MGFREQGNVKYFKGTREQKKKGTWNIEILNMKSDTREIFSRFSLCVHKSIPFCLRH